MNDARPIDRYVGNADVFPILKNLDYFNHAGASPWPTSTADCVIELARHFNQVGFTGRDLFAEINAVRSQFAKLLNARGDDEIALVRNTSDGISTIATGIDWKPGDRIVSAAVEYPSNVYPWMDVCQRHGVELISAPEHTAADGTVRVSEDELLALADHPRTKLIALSHVQWASGQVMDLEKIGASCRSRGVLFAVDVIQSLGAVPVDVQRMNIDFVFSGGHKWLMGPAGAGVLFCRRELIEGIVSPIVGALSVVNPFKWELNFTRSETAMRFETGTPAITSAIGLGPSLAILLDVGADAINDRLRILGDRFASGAAAKGYTIASPRDGAVSGSVCFTSPTIKPGTIVHDLRERSKIELAARSERVRFAPHFYNTVEQVDRLIEALPAH